MDSMLASIKSIFKLNNLRRVPGRAGKFVRATENLGGLDGHVYLDEANNETFAPVSLQILVSPFNRLNHTKANGFSIFSMMLILSNKPLDLLLSTDFHQLLSTKSTPTKHNLINIMGEKEMTVRFDLFTKKIFFWLFAIFTRRVRENGIEKDLPR